MQSWVGGALPRIQGVAAVMGVTPREACPDGRGVSPCRAIVARRGDCALSSPRLPGWLRGGAAEHHADHLPARPGTAGKHSS